MKVYTIGFTKKSAREFFALLKKHSVKKILDIRLNNCSQLAGFSKGADLEYFCEICGIGYEHNTRLSPTKSILDDYKKKRIGWPEYEEQFLKLLSERKVEELFNFGDGNNDVVCFLCSEEKADQCHRRLVAEYFKCKNPKLDIEIVHI
ncbi:DUF488 domain-containing protein [Phosphitispora fastidiosa]|uniref:DUF488 domain-containing protein n=1 Tax=Phosphitispora fastidiosa TaxID=2837202 RepID=UPI001E2BA628|nr:DUF488 domain-containing protein [Phosphitispora fastidiosa]MBU7006762.1 protein of unknown function (DUF488 family) [Phosphitispora fastidiosa]